MVRRLVSDEGFKQFQQPLSIGQRQAAREALPAVVDNHEEEAAKPGVVLGEHAKCFRPSAAEVLGADASQDGKVGPTEPPVWNATRDSLPVGRVGVASAPPSELG